MVTHEEALHQSEMVFSPEVAGFTYIFVPPHTPLQPHTHLQIPPTFMPSKSSLETL